MLRTMSEWQTLVAESARRQLAFATTEGIWLQVPQEAGRLANVVRRSRGSEIRAVDVRPHLARMTRSCFVLAERVGFDLGAAVWHKYPLACPYCVAQHPDRFAFESSHFNGRTYFHGAMFGALAECICTPDYKDYADATATLNALRSFEERAPKAICEAQGMIASIYARRHAQLYEPTTDIIFHLLEEVNEVAVDIEEQQYLGCKNEVADVFTWLCSFATLKEIDIEDALASVLDAEEDDAA